MNIKEEHMLGLLGAITSLKYLPHGKSWKYITLHFFVSLFTTYACTNGICSFFSIIDSGQIGLIGFIIGTFATVLLDKVYTELKVLDLRQILGKKND